MRFFRKILVPLAFALLWMGCGGFAARRMAQAPNSYPTWLAPKAPVALEFSDKLLTAFTNRYVEIESPAARLRYRVIEPANYEFRWTNRLDKATKQLHFEFKANIADLANRTNRWSARPRGTVVLIHGYGVAGFAMLPWGLLLAQEGWRCVVMDLRGHGKSTGERIYFGTEEAHDVSVLLDELEQTGRLVQPVSVLGDSLGAVIALRMRATEPRVKGVVAISPYADLSKAILNIADEYARWIPDWFLKAGIRALPKLLHTTADALNPETWISALNHRDHGVLFIAGAADKIAPLPEVERLYQAAGAPSELLIVPNATHEALPFYLDALTDPVTKWLAREGLQKPRLRTPNDL